MYRREPLFSALDPEVVSSGLRPDLHPLHKPLWVRGDNVSFHRGRVERLVPASVMVAAGGAGRGLSQHQDSAGVRWVWWGNDLGQVRRWFAGASELITTMAVQQHQTSGVSASMFDFTHYGDWTIINNGFTGPKIYKPGGGLSNYAPALGNVRGFIKVMSFVLAIGYDTFRQYAWSDSEDIEDWDFASTENLAGHAPIDDFETRIKAYTRLGPAVSVFAEDQMALIQFIGEPAVFTHRVVLDGIGACGKAAVCSDGRSNYGVSRNGIWRTDGQDYRYIDRDRALQKYLQKDVNWDQASKIVAARNDVSGCIDFRFPMRGANENNEGWRYDPVTGGWSSLGGIGAQVERVLFRQPLAISSGNNVVLLSDDPALAGALDLQTKPLLVGSPHVDTYIDEVDFLLNAASNVEFRIGASQTTAAPADWSPWQALHTDMRTYRIALRVSGAYHTLQLRNTADNWDLDLQGFILYGAVEGSRRDSA